jgi:hypothetical protein
MRSPMHRTVVANCTATVLLGPAVGMASASRPSVLHWVQSRRASAAAARAAGWTVVQSPSPGSHSNVLSGVAVVSATNAWAVGTNCGGCSGGQTPGALTVHWNGTAWKQQSSPSPGGSSDQLEGVAATSAANAWAVGFSSAALIVHWDGAAWKQQSSPNPGAGLGGVAATSAANAWAVGGYRKGGISHTLALHCC